MAKEAKEKTPNYTVDMVKFMEATYDPENSDETVELILADEAFVKKTKRSVISKLVREGVYVAPEKPKTEKKDQGPSKKELIGHLVTLVGNDLKGIEGATKTSIETLIRTVENLQSE